MKKEEAKSKRDELISEQSKTPEFQKEIDSIYKKIGEEVIKGEIYTNVPFNMYTAIARKLVSDGYNVTPRASIGESQQILINWL